jgi:hypothetical protein
MDFEEAQFMAAMYNISPELTCQCDEVHICQQCMEDIASSNIISIVRDDE